VLESKALPASFFSTAENENGLLFEYRRRYPSPSIEIWWAPITTIMVGYWEKLFPKLSDCRACRRYKEDVFPL